MTHEPEPPLKASAEEEIGFWQEQLTLEGEYQDVLRMRLDPDRRQGAFSPVVATMIPLLQGHFQKQRLRCLELGPGPLSTMAHGVDQGWLDVTAVDVLADRYAKLLERHEWKNYPIRPVKGTGETLGELFPAGSFDFAFCKNALDHTDRIDVSFDNLVKLVRPDGCIVLEHHWREGTRQAWSPSHNWDMYLDGRTLVATGRDGEQLDLARRDDIEMVYLCYRGPLLDDYVDVVYRKLQVS